MYNTEDEINLYVLYMVMLWYNHVHYNKWLILVRVIRCKQGQVHE
jgi:hypothetical protein